MSCHRRRPRSFGAMARDGTFFIYRRTYLSTIATSTYSTYGTFVNQLRHSSASLTPRDHYTGNNSERQRLKQTFHPEPSISRSLPLGSVQCRFHSQNIVDTPDSLACNHYVNVLGCRVEATMYSYHVRSGRIVRDRRQNTEGSGMLSVQHWLLGARVCMNWKAS